MDRRPCLSITFARSTLLSKAQVWYAGAIVSDMPKGPPMFTGGFPRYRETCAAVAQNAFRDLAFEPDRSWSLPKRFGW
jgi:hypothetical protein